MPHDPKNHRPLSPHLQVYKPQITSVLSIMHRFTGIGLIVGIVGMVYYVWALADGEATFNAFIELFDNVFVGIVILGVIFSCMYHALNGIRHLMWDFGFGFDLKSVAITGWAVVILSILLTAYIGIVL